MAKHLSKIILGVGIIAIVFALLFRFGPLKNAGSVRLDVSSTLLDSIDISELSTAEFKYRGIAEIYNEKKTKVKCRICYNAVVKAGINMKDVDISADQTNKTVTATLPKIDIKVNIVDEQSMTVLPSDAKIEITDMIKYSKADVEKEAKASKELKEAAQENLIATIEGMLLPVLKSQGYTLICK